jgi:O-antigen/teichoic acid export membrane protein
MNNSRLLIRNSAFSLLTTLMGRASASLTFIIVARILGPTEAGVYGLGVAFSAIGAGIAYWGLDQVIARDLAQRRDLVGLYSINFIVGRAVLATIVSLAIAASTLWPFRYDAHTRMTITLMAVSILPNAVDDVWASLFVALERMDISAFTAVTTGIVHLVLAYFIVQSGGTAESVALVVVATSLARLTLNTLFGIRYLRGKAISLSFSFITGQLREALPFLFINLCITLGAQADTVLLSLFLSEYEVGLYRGALTIVTAGLLLPEAFRVAVLPTMARLYSESYQAFVRMYQRFSFYLVLIALPISGVIFVLADFILTWLYGQAFAVGAVVLRILCFSFLFNFLVVPNARALIILKRQDIAAKAQGIATLVGLGATLVLTPLFSMEGAAIARVASVLVLFFGCYQYISKHVSRFSIGRNVWRPLFVMLVVMGTLRLLMADFPILVNMLVAGSLYIIGLLGMRVLSRQDIRNLFHLK